VRKDRVAIGHYLDVLARDSRKLRDDLIVPFAFMGRDGENVGAERAGSGDGALAVRSRGNHEELFQEDWFGHFITVHFLSDPLKWIVTDFVAHAVSVLSESREDDAFEPGFIHSFQAVLLRVLLNKSPHLLLADAIGILGWPKPAAANPLHKQLLGHAK